MCPVVAVKYAGIFKQTVVLSVPVLCSREAKYQLVESVCLFGWWAGIHSLQINSLVAVAVAAIFFLHNERQVITIQSLLFNWIKSRSSVLIWMHVNKRLKEQQSF